MSEASQRIELLIKKEGLEALQNSTVMIVGVGGVGSYCQKSCGTSDFGGQRCGGTKQFESSNAGNC